MFSGVGLVAYIHTPWDSIHLLSCCHQDVPSSFQPVKVLPIRGEVLGFRSFAYY